MVKCERDWQGPSDDECVDDLLVVSCQQGSRDHKNHIGAIIENYPGGTASRPVVVWWISGTGLLHRLDNNSVYRSQFKREG